MLQENQPPRAGIAYATGAYLAWGLFPLYWRQLDHHAALAILGHRVVWSFAFVALLLFGARKWGEFGKVFQDRKTLLAMASTTFLISGNWFLFIWAVNAGRITEASLGYYINPLVNILLARWILGERLRPLQLASVVLAGLGVLYFSMGLGVFPWVSLVLAGSFGVYGLIRKMAPVDPLAGLAVETALAAPLAVILLATITLRTGAPLLGSGSKDLAFLLGSGAATAIPLLWFAAGAKRLRYSTMGILQYLAPTCQLGLAVWVYGEPFTERHGITFTLIWVAVSLYLFDGLRAGSRLPIGTLIDPPEAT